MAHHGRQHTCGFQALKNGLCIGLSLWACEGAIAKPGFPMYSMRQPTASQPAQSMPPALSAAPGTPQMTTHGFAVRAPGPASEGAQGVPSVAPQGAVPRQMASPASRVPQAMPSQGMMPGQGGFPVQRAPGNGWAGPAGYPQAQPYPTARVGAMNAGHYMPGPYPPGPYGPGPAPSLETARQFEREGNFAGAEGQYVAMLNQRPQDRTLLISYGRMKHRANDLAGSVQIYQHALQFFPNDPVILNDLGLCFARMGEMESALATLQTSVSLRPDSQRYRNNLAIVMLEMGRTDEAEATLAEVHGEVLAKYNVAILLNRRGKNAKATELLAELIDTNPDFGPARTLLAQMETPLAETASLPRMGAPGSTSGTGVIQRQSAVLEQQHGHQASPAVFMNPVTAPDVEAYPIPIPGLDPQP